MSTVDLLKIQKLFQAKKFSEIIFEIETSTSEKDSSPTLHNLLGVCRASQKGRSDRDVKYEGVVTSSDPTGHNSSLLNLSDPKSPGVFIGDTRAFSSNDHPWTETGSSGSGSLLTSSSEVSVSDLTFLGDVKIEGISPITQSPAVDVTSYTHKIPVTVYGVTYYLLLTQ